MRAYFLFPNGHRHYIPNTAQGVPVGIPRKDEKVTLRGKTWWIATTNWNFDTLEVEVKLIPA